MKNAFYYSVNIGLVIIDLILVLAKVISWGDFISIAVLGVTAIAIGMQAFRQVVDVGQLQRINFCDMFRV